MSTTIDQQVVEMRFDNRHFETNVSNTMSTLDKLKQKLDLSGAAKGFDSINTAAKNVDMAGLGGAVETVSAKFSALQVMGVTALANITNSAINAGKNIVRSLTIDPVTTGFSEYELKMGSIQTIMAGTGESLDTVNKYLNELNKYSDDTIYSFKDMTANIGKFTNAGVKLEDAVLAIKGISNEAALSGANANEASRAMYNFSQALSSGFVKLIDWKSIELANMATKDFKEQLIKTAVEVGTLKEGAEGMYDVVNVISKANASSLNATKNFNDSLGNQWMTTEVLIETLRKYADETTEIGAKASAAATEVKTFSMMMDTLREAAQSGWAQTWELLVGDFEEAKAFFTELSGIFGEILGNSADRRNNLLGGALTSNWDKLITKINEAGIETSEFEESIRKVVGDDTLDPLIEEYKSLDKVVKAGKISTDDLKKAFDAVAGTGADSKLFSFVDGLKEIQRMLQRGHVGEDVKKLQTALDELGYDLGAPGIDGIIGPITEAAIKAFQEANGLVVDGIVGPETMAALEEAGKKVNKLDGDVEEFKNTCSELIDEVTKKGGRELLLESLLNIINAIRKPLSSFGKAWGKIFAVKPVHLYNIIEAFSKFTGLLIISDENAGKLQRTFEGLFALFKIVTTIAGGAFKIAFKALTVLLEKFDMGILDLAANIGDALVGLSEFMNGIISSGFGALFDWLIPKMETAIEGLKTWTSSLKETKLGGKVFDAFEKWPDTLDGITKAFSTGIEAIGKWISKIGETELFKDCAKWFEEASQKISEAIDSISDRIDNFSTSTVVERLKTFYGFLSDVASSITHSETFLTIVDGITSAFDKLKTFFSKFKLPEFNINNLKTFFTDLTKIGEKIKGSGDNSFLGAISGFGRHLKDNVIGWNWTVFKETALEKFVTFWLKVGDKVKEAFDVCKEVALSIKKFLFGTEEVNLPVIMDAVTKFLWIVTLIKTIQLMDRMVSPFDNISDALNNLASSLKWDAIAGAFKSMALALAAFTLCIVVLASMPDTKKAWSAAGMLIALMVVMGTIVTIMGIVASKVDGGLNAAGVAMSLLMLVGSIVLLVYALKEIDALTLKDPSKTFLILSGILLALTAGVRMVSKAGGSSFRSVAAILTLMAALKLMLEVIEDYDKFDWSGKSRAIEKMLEMLIALSVAIRIASGGTKAGASSSGLALTLIAMVVSLKILLGVIEDFAALDENVLLKGGAAVVGLLAVMTIMAAALSRANKGSILEKGQKSVNNFTGLAVALLAVVAAIWLLGKMDIATLKQGGFAVGQVLLLFALMLAAVGAACSGLKIGSLVTMLVAIGLLMAETAAIIKLLEGVPWQSSLSSAGALAGLLLALAATLRIVTAHNFGLKRIFKWVLALGALTVLVSGLAFILYSIKGMNPASAVGNAIALGGLLAAMAGVLHILSALDMRKLSPNKMTKLGLIFVGMTAILATLGLVLAMMSALNVSNALPNALALSTLISVLAGVLAVLSLLKVNAGIATAVIAIAALGAVILELGYFLHLMDGWNLGSMLPTVGVLSTLLVVLTGVMAACTGLGLVSNPAGIAVSVVAIALLGAVVLELGYFLHLMAGWNIGSMLPTVGVLSTLLVVLTGVMAACTGLGLVSNPIGLGASVVAIALLGAVVLELGYFLHLMDGWNLGSMLPTVKTLSVLLFNLTAVLAVVTVLGFAAGAAVAGIGALTYMITALGGLVLAIGALMSIPGLDKFLDTGITSLEKLARGIGSIISNFGEGLTSKLPAIGENLSDFADNLGAFLTTMNSVDDSVVDKAKKLAEAILTLTKGDFLSTLSDLFQKDDGNSLTALGTELSSFAKNAGNFIGAMDAMKPETATSMEAFCNAVVALNDVCGNNNFSDGALSAFGASIAGFAGYMKDASASLSDLTDADVDNIKRAATAGQALAELNAAIPRSDGGLQSILGEQDLAVWGTKISAFADSLIAYSTKVSGKNIDTEAIARSTEAATAISDLNAAIPKQGGLWQMIAGSQDLATWGVQLTTFADALVGYSTKISGGNIDPDAITRSADAASALADVNSAIPTTGGLWEMIAGGKDLSAFGAGLTSLADGLLDYSNTAVQIDDTKIDAITKTGTAVDEIKAVVDKLPTTGGISGWFGEKDPASFGEGILALANGINRYCTVAAEISQEDIDAITFTQNAVNALAEVMKQVPSIDEEKTLALKNAVTDLRNICITLNAISTEGYDFSGTVTLKTEIGKVLSIINDISASDAYVEFQNLSSAITEAATCASTLAGLNGYTYGGVDTLKGALTSLSDANIDGVINAFSGKAESMRAAVSSIVNAMVSGLNTGSSKVVDAMTSIANSTIDAAKSRTDEFKVTGIGFAAKLSEGIKSRSTTASTAGKTIGTKAASGAREKYSGMYTAGQYLGEGLVNGIENKWDDAYNAGYTLGQMAVQGEKDGQQSNSPSKLTVLAGKWLGEGLIIGMDRIGGKVYTAGKSLGDTATGTISSTIARIASAVNTDIDAQPTIRPVLDLSDVKSGASALSSMLNMDSSVGVHANLGAISSMMSGRSQNGSNADVVSALDKLSKKMDDLGNTTYQINGVTYDDGSNVHGAVRELARAIKLERRT